MKRTPAHYFNVVAAVSGGEEGDVIRVPTLDQARHLARYFLTLPETTVVNIIEVTIPVGSYGTYVWRDTYSQQAQHGMIAYRNAALAEALTPPDPEIAYPSYGPNDATESE